MKFAYKIVGRTFGVTEQTEYLGEVEAQTSGMAIFMAIEAEFGTRSDPLAACPLAGWADYEVLDDLGSIKNEATVHQFDNGDATFCVEVWESDDNEPLDELRDLIDVPEIMALDLITAYLDGSTDMFSLKHMVCVAADCESCVYIPHVQITSIIEDAAAVEAGLNAGFGFPGWIPVLNYLKKHRELLIRN